ncbi:MAG TPA: hypothetical protein VJP07_01510 [Dehalococcoidia bacterium]|nr:hypothetical protein [Dehalococcoidia bacterium]
MNPVLLAASDYGLVVASGFVLLLFLVVGWVVIQGTRAQMFWRTRVDEGDTDIISMLVAEEIGRWRTMRMPKGLEPGVWHGIQTAELVEVQSDGVRLSATAEGQYAMVGGRRQQVSSALGEGMKVTAKLADMALYDIPNVRLPWVQVDIYSTYRDAEGAAQRRVISTVARREIADELAWEELEAEAVVHAFGGRFLLDDRGNALPIDADGGEPAGVPAAFYKDD